MNKQLFERRTELVRAHAILGVPLKTIIAELSKKYEVPEAILYKDWERRERWLQNIIQLNDPSMEKFCFETLLESRARAWQVYSQNIKTDAQDGNARVALNALKVVIDSSKAMLTFLMESGRVRKAPLEIKGQLSGMQFEFDPDVKRLLLESADRQRKELESNESPK
jgi:hypothetical protein